MNRRRLKFFISITGVVLLFSGVLIASISYLSDWNVTYVWLGGGISVFGLVLIGSPEAWFQSFIALINS